MQGSVKYSQIWVKVAIGSGLLLGILLLVQTIGTYFFVYDKVVREEVAQEVERKESALLRAAVAAKLSDIHQFGSLLQEMQRESPKQLAWVRIVNMDSEVIAQVGTPLTAVPTPDELRRQLQQHQSRKEMIQSQGGEILVVDSRLRFFARPFGPPGEGRPEARPGPPPVGPPGALFTEIAIYTAGVTVNFGPLRQNLIVGCLAAIALLVSMVLIGVLFNRYIRARQLEQQLELARTVQADLLPTAESRKPSENLEFAAAFLPAATVGGDFYDVFTSAGAPVSIVLGDVAGKGISAALLMGVLHGAIRSMRWTRSALDQEEASQWLNQFLCEKTSRERFVSLFWAYFLPETGVLRYVNAGHLPPLLVRSTNGAAVERLEAGGPVLGLLPQARYCSGSTQVDAGDVLVVFSDGICEATNELDEEFGESRIAEIVRQNIALSPQQICDAILHEVNEFLGIMKAHDDQTLLVVRLAATTNSTQEIQAEQAVSVAG